MTNKQISDAEMIAWIEARLNGQGEPRPLAMLNVIRDRIVATAPLHKEIERLRSGVERALSYQQMTHITEYLRQLSATIPQSEVTK